ncbi:hypothetical protein VNO78_12370 [Psophocarpus tetragonolobus]|uniref:C2H2-type domain-containing protein n=1 Tax=Psophocarpus tetragonolobus TaxID=3891 RepID=A0AAN9SP02_PSOTE
MDLSGERVSNGANNLQMVPYSENKKVCLHCKREFNFAKSLGGHIKMHMRRQKRSNFTRVMGEKSSKTRGSGPYREAAHTRNNQVSDDEIVDLSKSLVGSGWNVHRRRSFKLGSGDEILDLCKSLADSGWKVQKKRSSNDVRNKRVVIELDSSDDDCIESDIEDDCYNTALWEKLRRHDFTSTVHKSCFTKTSELMCKECKKYFKTYCDVFQHVLENAPINNDVQEVHQVVDEVGEVEIGKTKGKKN